MSIKYPQQIDIFDAKLPNEIIRANHINILQDAITAIEIYTLNLKAQLDDVINNGYDGYNVSVDSNVLSGLDGYLNVNNLYDALIVLKNYILYTKTLLQNEINNHITDQQDAHHSSSISVNQYNKILQNSNNLSDCLSKLDTHVHNIQDVINLSDNLYDDQKVINLLSSICDSTNSIITTINNNKLVSYLKFNQTDTITINENQNGLSFNVNQQNINHNNLNNIGNYTHQQIDNHINSNNVHGVLGQIVGTENSQILTNKSIYSAFKGCKVILFTDNVEKEEIDYYKNYLSDNDKEFEIRKPSITKILSNNGSDLVVNNPSLFNIGDNVKINGIYNYGIVQNINNNILTINFDIPIGNIDLSNKLLININRENPLLSYDYITKKLTVDNIECVDIICDNIYVENILSDKIISNKIITNEIQTDKIKIKEIDYDVFKQYSSEINITSQGVYNLFSINNINSIEIKYDLKKGNNIQSGKIIITKEVDEIDYTLDYVGSDLGINFIFNSTNGINIKLEKNDNIYMRCRFLLTY